MRFRPFAPTPLSLAAALVLLGAACAPAAPPAPTAAPQKAAAQPGAAPAAGQPGADLQRIIDGAKREGTVNVTGPTSLGEKGAQMLMDALNRKYGTSLSIAYTNSGNFGQTQAQIITERTAGRSSFDVFFANDSYYVEFEAGGHLAPYPYQQLFGLPATAISYNGHAVDVTNQIVLPAYNTRLVSKAEAPKTWEELADPKWQGKLGVTTSVHHIVRLSQLWGDDKTTKFVQSLAALKPRLGQPGALHQSLVLGEIGLLYTGNDSRMDKSIANNEPVAWAEDVRPVIGTTVSCGVIKDSPHPNAGALLCGFQQSKEAQDVWREVYGGSSLADPTSFLARLYAADRSQVLLLDPKWAKENFDQREQKYTRILGFQ